jgi:hypothetical protein
MHAERLKRPSLPMPVLNHYFTQIEMGCLDVAKPCHIF